MSGWTVEEDTVRNGGLRPTYIHNVRQVKTVKCGTNTQLMCSGTQNRERNSFIRLTQRDSVIKSKSCELSM